MGIQDVFAINMRNYRKAVGLTQEELAEKSGLHRTYIGGIEQRRINVSLKNVEKIADALGIDPALLFFHTAENAYGEAKHVQQYAAGDHALSTWTEDGIVFQHLDVKNTDIAIQILCALIHDGYSGDELAEQYQVAQNELLDFFKETRQRESD